MAVTERLVPFFFFFFGKALYSSQKSVEPNYSGIVPGPRTIFDSSITFGLILARDTPKELLQLMTLVKSVYRPLEDMAVDLWQFPGRILDRPSHAP